MVPFLQLLRKDRSNKQKSKGDKRHNKKAQKSSNAPKRSQREGRKVKGGPTTTIVGASANKTTTQKPQKHQRKHRPLPTPPPNGSTSASDPNLSLRLSTTQEDLLKDLSVYVKDHETAPAENNAAAASSPSADTAATVPASPWTNAPVASGSGSTPSDGGARSLQKEFDSVSDANIFGGLDEVHGETEFERRNSAAGDTINTGAAAAIGGASDTINTGAAAAVGGASDTINTGAAAAAVGDAGDATNTGAAAAVGGAGDAINTGAAAADVGDAGDATNTGAAAADFGDAGGFSLLGEIDGIREKAKKAIRASNKTKMADLSLSQDVSGSSFDDSYSFNDSYEDDRVTLYDELVDFLCCGLTVPASSGAHDGRDRSSATTGRTSRRSDSHSLRHGRRRSKSGRGKRRGGASKDRSNRNRK